MADLEDLNYRSISEIDTDEALEHLRQIRLSRRTPIKQSRTITKKSARSAKVSADQAAELLALLGGSND